ncbi:gluconate 5-dehydrogenase [Azorhizobium oxalatiphilum]|uniref:Gluconate 5-dehydrogenase n=1 Tax=Azorhizobium oxalatiphilum TaxID=980631 RepID=A0A917CAL2_9HYPH|nr:SDR family oxidoreductase [Azorhizobium oxalatiphilum]GGF80975.1 gluconate 5-dehydrogenase [Azorhizobium oxalatiphilum]
MPTEDTDPTSSTTDREKSPFRLDGRTALVTAGVSGLGFEIARGLAAAGARVLVNGRDTERLTASVAAIQAEGGAALPCRFDATDEAQMGEALAAAGPLDILINNAGARDRRSLAHMEPDDFRRLIELDLVAPALLSRLAAPAMIAAGWGRIVNITSIAGPLSRAGDTAYTTAKGGLAALTRALAADFGPHGITVNAIAPGYFATAPNAAMVADPEVNAVLQRRTSLGRWGRPEEIAGAAVFLASPAAGYVTGHVLAVDGGYLAHF